MTAPHSSPGCHRQPMTPSARNTRPSMKRTPMSFWAPGPSPRKLPSGMGVTPPKMTTLDTTVLLPDAYLQLTVPGSSTPAKTSHQCVSLAHRPSRRTRRPCPRGHTKSTVPARWCWSLRDPVESRLRRTHHAGSGRARRGTICWSWSPPADAPARHPGSDPRQRPPGRLSTLDWLFPTGRARHQRRYGTVNQAISYGIPIVAAGLSEDKRDANARWRGQGRIDCKPAIRHRKCCAAVRQVVDEPATVSAPKRSLPSSRPTTRHQKSPLSSPISPTPLLRRPDTDCRPLGPGLLKQAAHLVLLESLE